VNDFDEILDKEYHYFLHLKRLYLLQMRLLEGCEGRSIKNDLIYQQMLFAGIDGLFVRFDNFHRRLFDFLNTLKTDHLDRFKRSNKRGLAVAPASIHSFGGEPDPDGGRLLAQTLTREHEAHFDQEYDRVFPGVKARSEGRPRHADFDLLAQTLREVFKPIRAHRDTVVAHWDAKGEPATVADLKKAMDHVEGLLKDLYFLSKLSSVSFELGGIAASVTRTSKDLLELILGTYRVRKAKPEEMDAVYLMGFDVWAEGQDRETYLAACRTSPKYARGIWYVLEDGDGKPVSSLVTYALDPVNGQPAIGIGSVATDPGCRRQGLAAQLVWDTMGLFHDRSWKQVFYLHSDVDPRYYEKLDFVRLPDQFQIKPGSTAMIRSSKEVREALLADPAYMPPKYF
jgi:predicted N-acetyltransferase YhbS